MTVPAWPPLPQAPSPRPIGASPAGRLPPLQNGDRLTRDEFERRYEAMTLLKKAEFIEGEVYVPSPVNHVDHGLPHAHVVWWLVSYRLATASVEAADNATVRLDLDNEPQPDACLRIAATAGGQSKIGPDGTIEGAPELVAEVAASSASYDLHAKLHVYRRNGVKEYIVWRVYDAAIDWFVLRGGRYERLEPDASGLLKSECFPGLWLDPKSLLEGDLAKVLGALEQGLKSLEHDTFAARLKAAGPAG